tara:strand:- start:132 stop:317 length:186 start_codon:yes stop_codon:yes gene_type:complete
MNKIPSIEELDEKIQQRVNVLADHDPQICTLRGAKEMLLALHDNGQEGKTKTEKISAGEGN